MNEFLEGLKFLRESEDHIEFKEARQDFNFNGGSHADPKRRRHCVLGYVAALANEGGGALVFGMADKRPHEVVGTSYEVGNLGALEDAIYRYHGLRVRIDEHFDGERRVVVFNVPSRPVGKLLRFEGVPMMRTGESLREMSDAEMLRILSEQEPDFSAKICEGLTVADLDPEALRVMKVRYAQKQKNPSFRNLSDEQVLTDLELLTRDGRLTYAALILLGKGEMIHELLPQAGIIVEYRKSASSITYDRRKEIRKPLFLAVDEAWDFLNQPLTNPEIHYSQGAYIFDVSAFNETTVREALLNALSHRSMRIQSEVVVKQSPKQLTILNPGGFPIGVTEDNILTVSSTPRCKRLVEVLQKTGLVERSGQGVDKMFSNCILDGKSLPSYRGTDMYQVQLTIEAELKYPVLMRILREEQARRGEEDALNVFQLIALYNVYVGKSESIPADTLSELEAMHLVRRYRGKYKVCDHYVGDESVTELTERQRNILNLLAESPTLSGRKLSEMLSVTQRTIERDLKALQDTGRLRHTGPDNDGRWEVIDWQKP